MTRYPHLFSPYTIQERIDIIHVSAGSYWSAGQYTFSTVYQPHGLNTELAAEVKKRANIPVTGKHADAAGRRHHEGDEIGTGQ